MVTDNATERKRERAYRCVQKAEWTYFIEQCYFYHPTYQNISSLNKDKDLSQMGLDRSSLISAYLTELFRQKRIRNAFKT